MAYRSSAEPLLDDSNLYQIEQEWERAATDRSDESFDRVAFAMRMLDRLCPPELRVAVCGGARRVHVESGRRWGARPAGKARWAMLAIPPDASRRAIVLAIAGLVRVPLHPYQLDVLFSERVDAG